MRLIPVLALTFLIMVCPVSPASAQKSEADHRYDNLSSPARLYGQDDGRVEVLAFFWYGCGACRYIDDALQKWAGELPSDVRFTLLPAAFDYPVDFHARIFLTLRALGLGHEADVRVFRIFQEDRKPVSKKEQLPELARALKLDENKFIAAFDSPEVEAGLERLKKLMNTYDLPGVPAMVIDGKYKFDIGQTQGPDGYFDLADELIERERKDRKK